jgi:hypothetical protein
LRQIDSGDEKVIHRLEPADASLDDTVTSDFLKVAAAAERAVSSAKAANLAADAAHAAAKLGEPFKLASITPTGRDPSDYIMLMDYNTSSRHNRLLRPAGGDFLAVAAAAADRAACAAAAAERAASEAEGKVKVKCDPSQSWLAGKNFLAAAANFDRKAVKAADEAAVAAADAIEAADSNDKRHKRGNSCSGLSSWIYGFLNPVLNKDSEQPRPLLLELSDQIGSEFRDIHMFQALHRFPARMRRFRLAAFVLGVLPEIFTLTMITVAGVQVSWADVRR